MAQRRYDVYGFRTASLEEAAEIVLGALGIAMSLRDSSYRGLYYSAGPGAGHPYLLQANGEGARWYRQFGEFGVTLMVSDQPDMDAIHDKLTAGRTEPVLLHTIVHTDDPEQDGDASEHEDEPGEGTP